MAPLIPLVSGALSLALLSFSAAATPLDNNTYEYIVVGTGPGGGPLAANLARAGHSVLVLEAGDDQTENVNVSQWINFNSAGNDPATRWDFFVKHSDDEAREARYLHRTWRKTDGDFYVGIEPPTGAKPLGIVRIMIISAEELYLLCHSTTPVPERSAAAPCTMAV